LVCSSSESWTVDPRVSTSTSALRMPVSSGDSSGPGGWIAARVCGSKARSASRIISCAVGGRWSGSLAIARRMT
jgi:hypothetical protein